MRFLSEVGSALIAALLLWLAAALVNLALFPFIGGEFHAMFAYSDGHAPAAAWAWGGYVGTLAIGAAALIWFGYPATWWAVSGAAVLVGIRYWWNVYTWQPQSASFHWLVGVLLVLIPPVILGVGAIAKRMGPGDFGPAGRWATRNLAILVLGVPVGLALLGHFYERFFLPAEGPYEWNELVDGILWIVPELLLPLTVVGALHLMLVHGAIRQWPRASGKAAFIASGTLLVAALILWRGTWAKSTLGVFAWAGLLLLIAYLIVGTPPPVAGAGEPVAAPDAPRR